MSTGFPSGDFLILSLGSSRVLDVTNCETDDGTDIVLFVCKERSLNADSRNPWNDNQVFFIDGQGNLASKQSKHPIDVEEDRIVLRHRNDGVSLPAFHYSAATSEITIHTAPDPESDTDSYVLSYIPKYNPRITLPNGYSIFLPPNGSFADITEEGGEDGESSTQGNLDTELDDSLEWIRQVQVVEYVEPASEKERNRRMWALLPIAD
ncbi:hypothetical protein FA15DRAFT_752576 [Coprinopsis marcescibilis]|uniref:Ricin B lectin domain-containing protein n=1 Tax=Coprinopsis marcescibilis TaxID=230819 RepID=A0A5C3L9Z5_COPMA|nr:hypothetical protein FA15DRAFT_752576 [Coprinopsis marcescibilis]